MLFQPHIEKLFLLYRSLKEQHYAHKRSKTRKLYAGGFIQTAAFVQTAANQKPYTATRVVIRVFPAHLRSGQRTLPAIDSSILISMTRSMQLAPPAIQVI
eukprot:scaffold5564_cov66-Cylindrotheca_fusiformis.AAC.5